MRALALVAGLTLAMLPIVWTGPHPLTVSLAVMSGLGVVWAARRSHPATRTASALLLLAQVAATHRLGSPPAWWPVVAAGLLFLFLDATVAVQERREGAPGPAAPQTGRLLGLGGIVVASAATLEVVVGARLGSGLLPTVAAVAAVSALVLGAAHLVGRRTE